MISVTGWDFQTVTNLDFLSPSGPGLTAMGEEWFLAWRRVDNNHICFTWSQNHAWRSARTAKGTDGAEFATSGAPALAYVGGRILMVWKGLGDDKQIWYSWYSIADGTWTPQAVARGTSGHPFGTSTAPSLAVVGKKIMMVWKGQDDDTRIWSSIHDPSFPVRPWTGQRSLGGIDGIGFGTSERPVLVSAAGALVLAWRGSGDSNLWFSVGSVDGLQWSPQRKASSAGWEFSSSTGPALAACGSEVLLTWKGYADDVNIWQSTMNAGSDSRQWSAQQTCLGDGVAFGTAAPPALACNGEDFLMVWRGSGDKYLWQSRSWALTSGSVQVPPLRISHASWMGELRQELGAGFGKLQLRQMMLPGCHQAGSYRVEWNLGKAPGIAGFTKILHSIGLEEETITGWAKAQTYHVGNQLEAGARYLDLRVAECEADGNKFYTFHSLFCVPWREILESVAEFASRHRSEIIILKVEPQYLPGNRWKEFVAELNQHLGELLVPPSVGQNATYDDVMRTRGNVICMVNAAVLDEDQQQRYPKLWGKHGADVSWFDKQSRGELLGAIARHIDEGPRGGFSGIQAIITPGAQLIAERKLAAAEAPFPFDKACMNALNARSGELPLLLRESVTFHQELLSLLVTKTVAEERPLGIVMIDGINEVSGKRVADLCIDVTRMRARSPQNW